MQFIEFRFYPANHSVVRAEYQSPCIPYEMTGPNKVGFYAGYHPISQITDDVRIPILLSLIPLLFPVSIKKNIR